MGARLVHLIDFDGARAGAPANLEAVGAIAARVAVPLQLAGGVDSAERSGWHSRPARPGSC